MAFTDSSRDAHPVYHVENVEASAADRADEDLLKMDHQKKNSKIKT